MIVQSTFKPAWWLSNAHAQTMFSTLLRSQKSPIDWCERLELPDGDFIDLSWSLHGLSSDSPLVILLHGLGGGVRSNYVAGQLNAFRQRGWRSVLMHFRGASDEPNRLARAYHSGDTADLDYVMQLVAKREPNTHKAIVGISMGGNILLKWLGECSQSSRDLDALNICAAVAVSVPYELKLVADRVNQGFSRIYRRYLLKKLHHMIQRKIKHVPGMPITQEELNKLNCFWTFDEYVTAPLHGFTGVHEYYRTASSKPYLRYINIPTLLLHAKDDPFMSPSVIPTQNELSSHVILELSDKGGHVGFIAGNVLGKPIFWLDHRIPEFLAVLFKDVK